MYYYNLVVSKKKKNWWKIVSKILDTLKHDFKLIIIYAYNKIKSNQNKINWIKFDFKIKPTIYSIKV